VYTGSQLRQTTDTVFVSPYSATNTVFSALFGIMFNRATASQAGDPILLGKMHPTLRDTVLTLYQEKAVAGVRNAFSSAVFHKRSAHTHARCCAAGRFASDLTQIVLYTYIYIYEYTYIYIYILIFMYMYTYIFMNVYICIYTYTYIYVNVYVYIYVYIYI